MRCLGPLFFDFRSTEIGWSFLMTLPTQCTTIAHFKTQIRVKGKRLYVICVQISAYLTAVLAGVPVALKHRCAPCHIFFRMPNALILWGNSAFPIIVSRPLCSLRCKVLCVRNSPLPSDLNFSHCTCLSFNFRAVVALALGAHKASPAPFGRCISPNPALLLASRAAGDYPPPIGAMSSLASGVWYLSLLYSRRQGAQSC
jgi:hypothetical protein